MISSVDRGEEKRERREGKEKGNGREVAQKHTDRPAEGMYSVCRPPHSIASFLKVIKSYHSGILLILKDCLLTLNHQVITFLNNLFV